MATDQFLEFQISLSTADDEKNYFSGSTPTLLPEINLEKAMPSGTYRVIDGELYRVAPGIPLLK